MFYEWNDKLSVGVPSIDRQHKVLISLINELHDAIENGEGATISKFVLKKLINYARSHFIYEESLFTRHDYIATEEHLASHKKITEQLGELNEKAKDPNFDLTNELMQFLKNWLNNHILVEDMGYSELLIKHKVE